MCTTSSKLNFLLNLYIFTFFYIYKHKETVSNNFKMLENSFFSVIIVNALNKDQGLVQIK